MVAGNYTDVQAIPRSPLLPTSPQFGYKTRIKNGYNNMRCNHQNTLQRIKSESSLGSDDVGEQSLESSLPPENISSCSPSNISILSSSEQLEKLEPVHNSSFPPSSHSKADASNGLVKISPAKFRSRSACSQPTANFQKRNRPCSLYSSKSANDVCCPSQISGRSSVTSSFRSKSLSRFSCSSAERASLLLEVNTTPLRSRDRKILELMVSRYEQDLQQEEFNELAHRAWEEEKQEMKKQKADEEISRQKRLIKTRQQFEFERKMKRAMLEEEELNLIMEKERALLMKAQKWHSLAEEQENLKRELAKRKQEKNFEKKYSQTLHLAQNRIKDEQVRSLLSQMMEHSMIRAAQKRQLLNLQRHTAIHQANSEEMKRHLQKKSEIDNIFKQNLQRLQAILEEKEEKARENYERIVRQRNQACSQQMEERERKLQEVLSIQQRLNKEYKEWQQQLVEYRALVSEKAVNKVQERLLAQQDELRQEQMLKTMKHNRAMQTIRKEEKKKLTAMKAKVRFKDFKSEMIARKKDQEVSQSRAMAWASAELRDKLSKTLNPENFNHKVRRVEIEARLLNRTPLVIYILVSIYIFLKLEK